MNYLSSGVSGLLRFTLVNLLRNWVVNFNRGRWSVYSGICGQFTPFFPPHASLDYFTPDQAHAMEGELKKRWKGYPRVKKGKEENNMLINI